MLAEPIIKDHIVPQGADYPVKMRYKDSDGNPIVVTGATVTAQLRKNYEDTTAALECNSGNGNIILDGPNGYFGFTLEAATTASMEATTYVYDLYLTQSDGDVTRAMQGKITLTPRVTQ